MDAWVICAVVLLLVGFALTIIPRFATQAVFNAAVLIVLLLMLTGVIG